MYRYLHTFLRFCWIFMIPAILAPVGVSLVLLSSSSYTAAAALWVEQPLYVQQQTVSDGYFYDSPAKQMANLLNELMATHEFAASVINDTSLKATVKNDEDMAALLETLTKKLKVEANNWRLINLTYTDSKAKISLEVLNSLITKFKAYYDDRMTRQGEGAASYYQSLIATAQDALDKANKELNDFLLSNQDKIGTEGAARAVRPEDLQFATLTQNRDVARKRYDDLKGTLEKIQMSYGAYLQGQGTTLRIQDKPQVFTGSSGKTRSIGLGAGIGLAVSFVIALAGTIILTLTDRTLRIKSYTKQSLKVGQVLDLPNFYPARNWKKSVQTLKLLEYEEARQLAAPESADGKKKKSKKTKPRFVLRQSLGLQIQVPELEQR